MLIYVIIILFFSNIRQISLSFGYKFKINEKPLCKNYRVLPLLSLQDILRTRTIPYIDNVSLLHSIVENQSEFSFAPGFLLANLKRNFILHESAPLCNRKTYIRDGIC